MLVSEEKSRKKEWKLDLLDRTCSIVNTGNHIHGLYRAHTRTEEFIVKGDKKNLSISTLLSVSGSFLPLCDIGSHFIF